MNIWVLFSHSAVEDKQNKTIVCHSSKNKKFSSFYQNILIILFQSLFKCVYIRYCNFYFKMNKIAVFGATGMTGLCVVKAALEKGLQIQALLRDPSKLPKEYEGKVSVIKGDVLNIEDVKKTLEGQDAVVVVLGTRNDLSPTTAMSEGLKNVIAGMKSLNISVLSVCLSAFLFYEPEKVPAMFHEINADHGRMFNALKDSELQWIAVNPPHIADQPPTGYITKHGESTGYRVISKYDLGKFFVDCLSMPEHYQKVIGISSNPQQ